jgi:hypothetical protein
MKSGHLVVSVEVHVKENQGKYAGAVLKSLGTIFQNHPERVREGQGGGVKRDGREVFYWEVCGVPEAKQAPARPAGWTPARIVGALFLSGLLAMSAGCSCFAKYNHDRFMERIEREQTTADKVAEWHYNSCSGSWPINPHLMERVEAAAAFEGISADDYIKRAIWENVEWDEEKDQ